VVALDVDLKWACGIRAATRANQDYVYRIDYGNQAARAAAR